MLNETKSYNKSFTLYEERKISDSIDILKIISDMDKNIENIDIKDECESYVEIKCSGKIIDLEKVKENKNLDILYNNLIVSISNAEITKTIND